MAAKQSQIVKAGKDPVWRRRNNGRCLGMMSVVFHSSNPHEIVRQTTIRTATAAA